MWGLDTRTLRPLTPSCDDSDKLHFGDFVLYLPVLRVLQRLSASSHVLDGNLLGHEMETAAVGYLIVRCSGSKTPHHLIAPMSARFC